MSLTQMLFHLEVVRGEGVGAIGQRVVVVLGSVIDDAARLLVIALKTVNKIVAINCRSMIVVIMMMMVVGMQLMMGMLVMIALRPLISSHFVVHLAVQHRLSLIQVAQLIQFERRFTVNRRRQIGSLARPRLPLLRGGRGTGQ